MLTRAANWYVGRSSAPPGALLPAAQRHSPAAKECAVLAERGNTAELAALLKLHASEDIATSADKHGFTPLHHACGEGHADCTLLLIAHGANVDAPNSRDETPLHLAAAVGQVAVVQILLDHGAAAALRTKDGLTCMDLALAVQHASVQHVLKEAQRCGAAAGAVSGSATKDASVPSDNDGRIRSAAADGGDVGGGALDPREAAYALLDADLSLHSSEVRSHSAPCLPWPAPCMHRNLE
jgi:hypothetical protein